MTRPTPEGTPPTPTPEVVQFMVAANGGRRRSFRLGGLEVVVEPHADDAMAADTTRRLSTALEDLEQAHREIAALRALVPPREPARLLGIGCVRFDTSGRMYLLGSRAKGWGAFAVLVAGWDDLFRRYAVRVVRHGQDSTGAWWEVENQLEAA